LNGTYSGAYGRSSAGPSHWSQFNSGGTGFGAGRLPFPLYAPPTQQWASRTGPMTPFLIISTTRR
jgi:hypothetical protein